VQLFSPRRLLKAFPALRGVAASLDAAVVGLIFWASQQLSPERLSRLLGWLFRRIGPLHSKTSKVHENLWVAFPEKSDREIRALTREVWGGVGALVSEYPNVPRICAEAEERFEFVVKGNVRALEGRGPSMFVSAHYGAWELSSLLAWKFGFPLTAMYNFDFLHSNAAVARRIEAIRSALPCELIPRRASVRPLVRALAQGRSVGLAVDYRFDDSELVPFFGQPAHTTTLPARLALRFGCDLVPIRVDRTEPGRYRVTVYEPLVPDDPAADPRQQAFELTQRVNQHFETWIRERPEQWVCLKRRWPKQVARKLRSAQS
jgi:KDO2-lipid IV(A) lauroyltransferase